MPLFLFHHQRKGKHGVCGGGAVGEDVAEDLLLGAGGRSLVHDKIIDRYFDSPCRFKIAASEA